MLGKMGGKAREGLPQGVRAFPTKEKPFKCKFEGCNAAFGKSYNLKAHYKTKKHSGEPAHKRGEPDPKRRKTKC